MAGKGGSDTDAVTAKKRAAQQAYQEELKRQVRRKQIASNSQLFTIICALNIEFISIVLCEWPELTQQ